MHVTTQSMIATLMAAALFGRLTVATTASDLEAAQKQAATQLSISQLIEVKPDDKAYDDDANTNLPKSIASENSYLVDATNGLGVAGKAATPDCNTAFTAFGKWAETKILAAEAEDAISCDPVFTADGTDAMAENLDTLGQTITKLVADFLISCPQDAAQETTDSGPLTAANTAALESYLQCELGAM